MQITKLSNIKVTVQDILNLEQTIEFSLPSDYKEFLQNYGFSKFDSTQCFDVKNFGSSCIDFFYGINESEYINKVDKIVDFDDTPYQFKIRIATDPGGNYVSIDKEDKIEFYHHERDEFYEIANNFTEFLDNLYE